MGMVSTCNIYIKLPPTPNLDYKDEKRGNYA